ncbi:MAG: hypothetical protein ACRENG_05030 [bacterium]
MNSYRQRVDELAKDPAHDRRISAKSMREAEVGIALEQSGKLKGPIRRDPRPDGGDFIDADGKIWDVKAFDSRWPPKKGGFKLDRDMRKIGNAITRGEYLVLDTQNLVPDHVQELREAIESKGWSDKILWYP